MIEDLRQLGVVTIDEPKAMDHLPNARLLPFEDDETMAVATEKPKTKPKTKSKTEPVIECGTCGTDVVKAIQGKASKSKKTSEPVDMLGALRLLLKPDDQWREFIAANPSDADLEAKIRSAWVTGARDTSVPCVATTLGTLGLWMGQLTTQGPATLEGKDLVDGVRVAFGGRPGTAKCDTPSKPAEEETPIVISREIEKKPLSWFKKSPYDTRGDRPKAWLEELAADLKTHGQLQPCLARPNGEHIAGWTRVEAAPMAGLKTLDVRIVTCTDAQARRLVLVENAKRRDLTEREKCEAYHALAEEYRAQGRQQKELAQQLGISESTLSNNLRLKSLPPEIWARYEAGGLSTDQLRRLAVHADRPLFVEGFLGRLNVRVANGVQPEPDHFKDAFQAGISKAFRPMAKDIHGNGRQFSEAVAKTHADELDVVEVEVNGRKQQMAANVDTWNKLNKEAKKAKTEKAAKAEADPATPTKAKAHKAEVDEGKRAAAIRRTWDLARRAAIKQRFAGKLNQSDRKLLARLAHFVGPEVGKLTVDDIAGDDDAYNAACHRAVDEGMDPDQYWADGDIAALVKWLQLNPSEHWEPTLELLSFCTEAEVTEIATKCGMPDEIDVMKIMDAWPKAWIPDGFYLEKPRRSRI